MAGETALNVSATLPLSHANGPGCRAVIWVQGCSLGCAGCYNPQTHKHAPKHIVPVSDLADWISSIDTIEGITFSGGEPFEQADAVSEVIRLARSTRPELSVFIFTGYSLDELHSSDDEGVARLLEMTDMLSTGRYVATEGDATLLWRGSSNQELVYLTQHYSRDMEPQWEMESPVEEVHLLRSSVLRTGFLGKNGPLTRALEALPESD